MLGYEKYVFKIKFGVYIIPVCFLDCLVWQFFLFSCKTGGEYAL